MELLQPLHPIASVYHHVHKTSNSEDATFTRSETDASRQRGVPHCLLTSKRTQASWKKIKSLTLLLSLWHGIADKLRTVNQFCDWTVLYFVLGLPALFLVLLMNKIRLPCVPRPGSIREEGNWRLQVIFARTALYTFFRSHFPFLLFQLLLENGDCMHKSRLDCHPQF